MLLAERTPDGDDAGGLVIDAVPLAVQVVVVRDATYGPHEYRLHPAFCEESLP
jgi:hypothetical protein